MKNKKIIISRIITILSLLNFLTLTASAMKMKKIFNKK